MADGEGRKEGDDVWDLTQSKDGDEGMLGVYLETWR